MAENNNNPWKGLDSYSYSDKSMFYGRTNETEALVNTILNNRFTILYGSSGVGKSSLLNAGVRPKLADNSFFVVGISMRQLDLKSDMSISSQLLIMLKECAKNERIDITPLSKNEEKDFYEDSLWYFFHTNEFWSSKNELLTPIVIIDQFEDVFKEEVRELSPEQFFNSLDELSNVVPPMSMRESLQKNESFRYSQSADFRFVFSLREDYLPRLDDFVYSLNIPELRKSRYGITLLDTSQAREIILGPANGIVSDAVADKIIDILSSQAFHNRLAHKIEPFLLSLFMYRVYIEMTKRGLSTISEELINKIGADVVNDFYMESMKKVSTRAMKHLENVLLTPKGHRDSISYDKLMASEKVSDEELKTLLGARIIKKYTINSVDRYEYTHDILSKYAQKNKEKREQSNKSQLVVGYLGTFVNLLLAGLVGWIMSAILTYISIPILIIASIVCSYGILNVKLTSKKKTIAFLGMCGLMGICIDLTQIVPVIGYVLYIVVCLFSLYLLHKFASQTFIKTSRVKKYFSVAFVWALSFLIVPVMCFGYNIYYGLNFARSEKFSMNTFYVKNGNGQYGLRDRMSLIIPPLYDDTLCSVGKDYIVLSNEKYGLIDSSYQIKMPIDFSNYIIDDNKVYFYQNGKEISENGIKINWGKSVSDNQKKSIREIVKNMLLVKGGHFNMGTNEKDVKARFSEFKPINGEEFIHDVGLSDYYLCRYEVTVGEWIAIMGYDPRKIGNEECDGDTISDLRIPVYKISYEQCMAFVEKIKEMTGLQFSLPTEAQWEYAARGGQKQENYLYSGSNFDVQVGWVDRNSDNKPHVVGEKGKEGKNSLGISDMTGNVAEFCKDCMSNTFYKESIGQKDPCCEIGEKRRGKKMIVKRGGSYARTAPENYIVTRRLKAQANYTFGDVGFRLAINPTNNE